ncbi:ribulokinase [Rhodococcus aerolatus]
MARGSDADRRVTVGVDFGTLSGRAVVVRVADGAELATAVHPYPHAVIDRVLPGTGERLRPDWALQHPGDWVEVLRVAVPEALAASGVDPADVVGVGTDFTACTVLPTTADGTPLCELADLAARPHAWPKLWRHHAAQPQADRITALAHSRREPWIARYGGAISSEWELAKGLQLLEEDPEVYARTQRWVEAADWIVWQLTGSYVRNACTAGYKGQLQDGKYPDQDYLGALHPDFADFVVDKVEHPVGQLGDRAGGLTAEAAAWTGLAEGTPVCVGNVDAHVTAPAAGAVDPGQLVAIMGTSTCHVMVSDVLAEVPGMCGVVEGGIVAGSWGYEAGQSGVGDIFGWFVEHGVPPEVHARAAEQGVGVHDVLSAEAATQQVGEHGLVALDWHSGNRSVLVDHELSAVVVGQTLHTTPADTYRALVEATAFGARVIVEAFRDSGVPVTELVVAGGLAHKPFVMGVYADVLGMPLSVLDSDQGPALGAALHAAVAAGVHADVRAAAAAMGRRRTAVHVPDPDRHRRYDALYAEYLALHDHFGRGGTDVLHRLRAIRREALS